MTVRVLVADGSVCVRNAMRHQVECMGCEVVAEVETAAQALLLFRTIRPEVVALGVDLPYAGQATPIDLLRTIKREAPATSVVMLGSTGVAGDVALCLREGALACVMEPFGSASFSHLWSKLSAVFPELRRRGFGAIMASPRIAPRDLANPHAVREIAWLAQARTDS